MSQASTFQSPESLQKKPTLTQASFSQKRFLQPMHSSQSNIATPLVSEQNSLPQILNNSLPYTMSAVRSSKRASEYSYTIDHFSLGPTVRYENTYQLGPKTNQKVNLPLIKEIITAIFEQYLENFDYEPTKAKEVAKKMSDEIKAKVKAIIYKRYKLIVNITILQNAGQSMLMVSRSMWNTETDTSCTVEYRNKTLYSVATIYATYCE